mmetsp:Transcript_23357/g.64797  ORF Transcript_23357/g.64797 Transcript_23357/m.64797 type:complete len:228 (+) Transcript_23357:1410-2093(+)
MASRFQPVVIVGNRHQDVPPFLSGSLASDPPNHLPSVDGAPDRIGNDHQVQPGLVDAHREELAIGDERPRGRPGLLQNLPALRRRRPVVHVEDLDGAFRAGEKVLRQHRKVPRTLVGRVKGHRVRYVELGKGRLDRQGQVVVLSRFSEKLPLSCYLDVVVVIVAKSIVFDKDLRIDTKQRNRNGNVLFDALPIRVLGQTRTKQGFVGKTPDSFVFADEQLVIVKPGR